MEPQQSSTELSSDDIAARLFALLREMDLEATSLTKRGGPTGLWYYGRHARPELKRPQTEPEWYKRLAQLLVKSGIIAEAERRYPKGVDVLKGTRERCDLVLTLPGNQKMWIEVKGAWAESWGRNHLIYRAYLLHPLVKGLESAGKTHTVPFDLIKLSKLRPPDAHFTGQLLIGFEHLNDPMDEDVKTLVDLSGLGKWSSFEDSWESSIVPGKKVRCWFWCRPADDDWSLVVG